MQLKIHFTSTFKQNVLKKSDFPKPKLFWKSETNKRFISENFNKEIWRREVTNNEPSHDKTNKMTCAPAKTQIIRPVWSEYSLYVWRNLGSLATHWKHAKNLIWLGECAGWFEFSLGAQVILLVLSWGGSTDYIAFKGSPFQNLLTLGGSVYFTRQFWECNFFLYIPELNINYLGLKFLIKSTAFKLTGFGLSPLPKQRFMHDDLGTRTSWNLVQYWTIRKF